MLIDQEPLEVVGYRLDVVAASVVDAVTSAAGWLYDRASMGWQVNVFVPSLRDARPLQILGVAAQELDADALARCGGAHELAVSATAFSRDAAIRAAVSRALNTALVGATLWGEGWPMPIAHAVHQVTHPLTAAAVAFKRQALVAAGLAPDPAELSEAFLTDLRPQVSDADLVPVAR